MFISGQHVLQFIVSSVFLLMIIGLTNLLAPALIPWELTAFWVAKGTAATWLSACTPLLIWGVVINFLLEPWRWQKQEVKLGRFTVLKMLKIKIPSPTKVFFMGLLTSVWVGITEEIIYRWLAFFAAFGSLCLINFLFFGFIGFGLPELFNIYIWAPLANFFTAGHLQAFLIGGGWLMSAALLSANHSFRDGHKYQGFIGWTNSWFIGMFMFYLMFTYGIFAAMLAHVLYDIVCYTWMALSLAIRKPFG